MGNLSDLGFNAAAVEPAKSFDLLPNGEYEVAIVSSDQHDTKAGDGAYIKLELQVLSGQFSGRKLWDNLNLWNRNQKAVEIAQGTLSSICRAVNVLTPNDTSELHNKPLVIRVAKKVDSYGEKNVIKEYKARTSSQAAMAQTTAQLKNPPKAPNDADIPF